MSPAEARAMRLRHLATAVGWTLLVIATFVWSVSDWQEWDPHRALNERALSLGLGHLGIWLVGLFGIGWTGRLEFRALQARQAAEASVRELAYNDPLTGLANRASLDNRLAQILALAQREPLKVALMFVDLDWFKRINDSLGHEVGDQVLKDAARRLQSAVRESDIVARLGGDEFVIVLAGLEQDADAATVAEKIVAAFESPFQVSGHSLHVSVSIGIALYPRDGGDASTLMKNADAAMYHAKDEGRAGFQFFRQEMNRLIEWRLMLESELREALAGEGLILHFQPQRCASSQRVCGFEALLRWFHPQRGAISPADFVPVAEQSGLIGALGDWVLGAACRQLAAWQRRGHTHVRVAVNLSARQLAQADLAARVRAMLEKHAIPAGHLEFEVTESTAMAEPERAIRRLHELREIGVRLAIDDFGTGYSSLAYLKRLPVQTLKIDKSFVQDIGVDANDTAIVTATIALAKSMGLTVVAEGVETQEQLDFLIERGCDAVQGYLIGRPAPAEECAELIMKCCADRVCEAMDLVPNLQPRSA